jgi:prepilin-type N-terminal cleavage/methylation domain-containing protein
MLHKLRNRKQEGFTIIEVLIVLAIAGLIILIVLLAVPALQRTSRNTAIKNDASALAGGISSFASNSDGATIASISANGLISGAGATPVTEQAKLQGGTTVGTTAAASASPHTSVIAHGNLAVWFGHNCADVASSRSTAIWYSIETTSGETAANNNKCVEA